MKGSRAAMVLFLAALAGCGGGSDGPSASERRAALDRWTRTADAACKKANAEIAKRGWPVNLVDLDRLGVRAANDVREASAAIQKLAPPEGSESRVKPFVDSLRSLDGLLDQVTSTTEEFEPERLNALAPDLQNGLVDVEKASKEVGLRECAANDEHAWVPDAIRAPVFAQQLSDVERKVTKRAEAAARPVSTPGDAVRNLDRLSDVLLSADRALSKLKPPTWATDELARYLMAVRNVTSVLDASAGDFSQSGISLGEYKAFQRKLNRSLRVEQKRFKALAKEIGAVPTIRGGGGGEEEVPGGDEREAA